MQGASEKEKYMPEDLPPEEFRKAMLTGTKGPARGTKLTKKFFMELPTGVYLVSNCYKRRGVSLFEEVVAPAFKRSKSISSS